MVSYISYLRLKQLDGPPSRPPAANKAGRREHHHHFRVRRGGGKALAPNRRSVKPELDLPCLRARSSALQPAAVMDQCCLYRKQLHKSADTPRMRPYRTIRPSSKSSSHGHLHLLMEMSINDAEFGPFAYFDPICIAEQA